MTGPSFITALAALVGEEHCLSRPDAMAPYVRDWWGRRQGQALAAVRPAATAQVAAIVRLCLEHRVAIFPQGGNTSVCGGAIPPSGSGGIVLNLARMNAVLAVEPHNNSMTVEGGCVLARAQEAANAAGRFFPLGLGSEGSCQIGGNIATNAGGTAVVRYGNMRDLVLGLEVVLPDGRIWNGLRGLRKNNTGYDLRNIFIGSEGTLGIVTAATLKLFPAMPHAVTALIGVGHSRDATRLGRAIADAFPAELSALELISRSQIGLVLKHMPAARLPIATDADWYLLVELTGREPLDVGSARLSELLAGELETGAVADATVAASEAQRQALWHVRHSVTDANKREGMGLSFDIAVPLAAIDAFLERAAARVSAAAPRAVIVVVGHLGDGNLHYIVMFDHATWRGLADPDRTRIEVSRIVYDLADELGGTFSAEHGIGDLHLPEMARYKDPVELDLMRGLKSLLDPHGLMNPGRVVPS